MRLDKILDSLASDDQVMVRRRIASSLHEVAILLGKNGLFFLKETFVNLLNDSDLEVCSALFKNVDATLTEFASDEGSRQV